MSPTFQRRAFLQSLGRSGAALAAGSWLGSFGFARAATGPARALVNQARYRTDMDRRVLGAFLQNLASVRCMAASGTTLHANEPPLWIEN